MKRSERKKRNFQIQWYYLQHRELSMEEIGEVFGLTKGSISNILKELREVEKEKEAVK